VGGGFEFVDRPSCSRSLTSSDFHPQAAKRLATAADVKQDIPAAESWDTSLGAILGQTFQFQV
jgi:hypothetical protein